MRSLALFVLILGALFQCLAAPGQGVNRFAILDEYWDIYYPHAEFPRLTTPQWVGEEDVDAVLVLAIDDMREHTPYENYLRPILERLKQIDGRAPVSIMACKIDPQEPHLQRWLEEGVSIETHTFDHPCPILAKGDFAGAKSTYDRCVDLFFTVPNNRPVAFRTPCMDGINSASPRLFAEILGGTTSQGHFLTLSSSIGLLLTPEDTKNPAELVTDSAGKPRFNKYLLPGYINFIRDYPYPYLIGNQIWETPFCIPDDYEAFRANGEKSPATVADMKASIDAIVARKGIWVMTFHPYAWLASNQVIELIDHVVAKHGRKAKFLSLREVNERLEKNLFGGQSTRARNGRENGARLLDLNGDGFLDSVIANETVRQTRVWQPEERRWKTGGFPVALARQGETREARFGVLDGKPVLFVANESEHGFWQYENGEWKRAPEFLRGLELKTAAGGREQGVRFRDFAGDDSCELLVSNPRENAVYSWSSEEKAWRKLAFALPEGVALVTADGEDNGVRFVDVNKDGRDDVIFSNEKEFGLWLYVPELHLGFKQGWTRQIMRGRRGERPEIPMISRGGEFPNNGAWFADDAMWVQNENTAHLTNLVERVSFRELLDGFQPAAKSPREALKTMVTDPEHIVELVAHEPAVQDPVGFEWGADGTLWVVEMRDYPNGINGRPGGVVKRLRDEDGDGLYERAEVFLNHLNFPTGVMPWKNGILISAAPEIIFAEDNNSDGLVDRTEVLFRGFVEGNQQHRVNGFEWGLDNFIHGANGDSGGVIEIVGTRFSVPIAGRDFRFQPDTRAFEATSGQTQFGKRRDDWGNWFGGANYTWGWHYVYPEEYLRRDSRVAVRSSHHSLNSRPDGTRVYPISRVQQRFNDIGMAGHVTSAGSFAPYRDELFGPEFERSIFISEPTHNVVHREVLEPDGVSFRSHRSTVEQEREFLASTDPWFRPTTVKTGPDGAIYIADMYRLVIEHPEWIPHDAQKVMDVRAGEDKGRIYRVRPRNKTLRAVPRFNTVEEIIGTMESPNGWQRDTAHRLLVERRAANALPASHAIARSSASAKARLQALCAIQGLNGLDDEVLLGALQDAHPAVREHAVRLSEDRLGSTRVKAAVLSLVEDPEIRVRYQLAFSLGEITAPEIADALARLAARDPDNVEMTTAIMSSSQEHRGALLAAVLMTKAEGSQIERLVNHLVDGIAGEKKDIPAAIHALEVQPIEAWRAVALARLYRSAGEKEKLGSLKRWAGELVANPDATDADRSAVLPLIDSPDVLGRLLGPASSPALQRAALARLARLNDAAVPATLVDQWKSASPSMRHEVTSVLLGRPAWAMHLVQELRAGKIDAAELGATGRQSLLTHSSDEVRTSAKPLFQPVTSEREVLVAAMLPRISSISGDPARGQALFQTHCALCHRAGEAGTGAGPNLVTLRDQSAETLLTALLDPNRAVEEKYWTCTIELKDGEEHTGILLNENAHSLTLVSISGVERTFFRREIARVKTSSRSIMPEGFEQFLEPKDLADLIAFIRAAGN